MKYLLVTLFLLISSLGFGQSVSAPDSKSFTPSTNGQDASGFVLSGFSSTATLLASISLINPSTGTSFYLDRLDGLTPASGFTLPGNKTRLVVTGTMANINTALASLKINTGSVKGNVQLSVAATVNPVGYFYNGVNGHFYRPISGTSTYTAAKNASVTQTFKGQTGYLVTITSQSEQDFIVANVPGNNIWIALSDRLQEGYWRVDAGPESGTLIKTQNGQTAGNISGQYNNWCGGEPNDAGGEDYAVTKWGGGGCWNDLPDGAGWTSGYVVEFGTWTDPDNQTFTEFYTNSITHSNGEVLSARFDIDFGSNVDETKFSAKGYTYTNNTWNIVTGSPKQLSGLGKVDLTSLLDTVKINGIGYRATTTAGQTEWAIINPYNVTLGGHQLLIDEREFNGTGVSPSDITSIQLFDIYNGPVTVLNVSGWWKTYLLPGNLTTNITNSSYQAQLRLQDGWYGTRAEFVFSPIQSYKQHGIELTHSSQTELNTLYNSIISVSDVYLAFKELADGGIFGNQSGMGLTNGIQYLNADVDGNGIFNESDTYKLLQHLTGVQPLSQSTALTYLMKLYNKSDYDAITTTNWNTKFNQTRNLIPFTLNGMNNSYDISVTWKGDVNQSHSALQSVNTVATNSVKSMNVSLPNQIETTIISEMIGDSIYVYLTIDPIGQELVGIQFKLNYDNSLLKFSNTIFKTKGAPTNYVTDKIDYINLGSLITNGDVLDNTTQYKISFTSKTKLDNILGLISIGFTDAVNKSGKTLKVIMK